MKVDTVRFSFGGPSRPTVTRKRSRDGIHLSARETTILRRFCSWELKNVSLWNFRSWKRSGPGLKQRNIHLWCRCAAVVSTVARYAPSCRSISTFITSAIHVLSFLCLFLLTDSNRFIYYYSEHLQNQNQSANWCKTFRSFLLNVPYFRILNILRVLTVETFQ